MPLERKNSFHLMLSDDELELLRLLAEREGLNASDFLRSVLRRVAGPPPHLAMALQLGDHLAKSGVSATSWYAALHELAGAKRKPKPKPKKK